MNLALRSVVPTLRKSRSAGAALGGGSAILEQSAHIAESRPSVEVAANSALKRRAIFSCASGACLSSDCILNLWSEAALSG